VRGSGVASRACRNPAYLLGLRIGEADGRSEPDVTCALCYMVFLSWLSVPGSLATIYLGRDAPGLH